MSKMKEKIKLSWEKVPLNKKFTVVFFSVLVVPILLSTYLLLNTLHKADVNHLLDAVEGDLSKIQTFASANSTMATAVLSMVQSNPQLSEALSTPHTTRELVAFHQEVTPYFETISLANPNVRALRIYASTEYLPERYPVFVDSNRVIDEAWFSNSLPTYPQKRINYSENLSDYISQYAADGLISFYQSLDNYDGDMAVVEVSFFVDDFFGEVFTKEENGICFVSYNASIFVANEEAIGEEKMAFFEEFILESGEEALTNAVEKSNGHTYAMRAIYCPDTNLHYYIITNLSQRVGENLNTQMAFVGIVFLLFIVFSFIFQNIVNVLLRRIYQTVEAMRGLESGNTLEKIPDPISDELGQLQMYYNQMIVQIDTLIEKESARALLEKDAELKALQNQINAHFLYNVLNNIEMMAIVEENYLIADTVTALARLLRYSMKWNRQMVPLEQEIEYVKDYIQLFNMRFDNEIQLICDISKKSNSALIPKMSVQPVIENAIVHGIENLTSDEKIYIEATITNGILSIEITDTGMGMEEDKLEKLRSHFLGNDVGEHLSSGIGLRNVHERVTTRFGKTYGLEIESTVGAYTKVTIALPYTLQE